MRIYIKDKDRKFSIPAPFWLVGIGLKISGSGFILRTVPQDKRKYLEMIDFEELAKGFKILKNYKGLILVHVESEDGVEVKITI